MASIASVLPNVLKSNIEARFSEYRLPSGLLPTQSNSQASQLAALVTTITTTNFASISSLTGAEFSSLCSTAISNALTAEEAPTGLLGTVGLAAPIIADILLVITFVLNKAVSDQRDIVLRKILNKQERLNLNGNTILVESLPIGVVPAITYYKSLGDNEIKNLLIVGL